MCKPSQHRKRIRHFDDPRHVRELTFSCYQRRPLLCDDERRTLLAESINRAVDRYDYRLTAFVFMPDHVHLLVYPLPNASEISSLLWAIKRPFSYRVKKLLESNRDPLLEELTIRTRPGGTSFRFWQEGPGYDRNLVSPESVQSAIEYIHRNPVRRGFCQRTVEWPWSSARYYELGERSEPSTFPKIEPIPAEWLTDGGVHVT